MANQPRYAIIEDGSTFHVTWQCHNHSWLLEHDWAKQLYYDLILKYKDRYNVTIYSYCFMSSHPHLTGRCENKKRFSDFFRVVNACFARAYNKQMGRRGQVVMDRFKSPRIETNADLLKVMFYVDLNPKRARMVVHPNKYRWSSFHFYAYGRNDPLVTMAPSYTELAATAKARQKAYLAMVEDILKNDWKEKRPYSSIPFIGNPDWVKEKSRGLRELCRRKQMKWRERHRRKFVSNNSP
jgi:putative transposase